MIDEKKLIEDIINTPSKVMNEIPYEATMFTNIQDRQNEILDIIDRQPKVGQWIPCSERLPDEPEENPMFEGAKVALYLVSCGEEFYPFRAFWNGKDFTDGLCKVDAEAWMPLPPAFEGE